MKSDLAREEKEIEEEREKLLAELVSPSDVEYVKNYVDTEWERHLAHRA
jgi:hypothetical protein